MQQFLTVDNYRYRYSGALQGSSVRTNEVYALECYACGAAVEIPVDGEMRCPRCHAKFDVEWRDEAIEPKPAPLRAAIHSRVWSHRGAGGPAAT